MSRYSKYDEAALEILRKAQENVRIDRRNRCEPKDLLLGFILNEVTEIKELTVKNGLTLRLHKVQQEQEMKSCAHSVAEAELITDEPSGGGKICLSEEFRAILDQAEYLARDACSVSPVHLLHAAWPYISPHFLSCVDKDGRVPSPEEIVLPPLPRRPTPSTTINAEPKTKQSKPLRYLPEIAKELTAAEPALPVIGREEEIQDLMALLVKCFKPNPLLIGEAGVGKTAIVEGLASRIRCGQVPKQLQGARIFELRVSDLVAGTGLHGSFEERMRNLINELEEHPDVILFLDEIHQLVQQGSSHNPADIFKPALSRGRFRCIGATTPADYDRIMRKDSAICRRFHTLRVEEPSNATLAILQGLRPGLEKHYGISIPEELLNTAVGFAREFLPHRRFPDKAIDLIDQSCTQVVTAGKSAVESADIQKAAAKLTGVIFTEVSDDFKARLRGLEEELAREIIGQNDAVQAVASTVQLCKQRLDVRPEHPDGVFLLLGPTGVGKTALAHALARTLTGSPDRLIRIDMSEFSEGHSVARLIGSPAGYVGYGDQPYLLGALRQNPSSVLLLDEFEKAHPLVHRLFLQAFDVGRLTDAHGEVYSLSNITIVATANILVKPSASLGFSSRVEGARNQCDIDLGVLKAHFPVELINRFDEIITFNALTHEAARTILRRRVLELANENLRTRYAVELILTEKAEDAILAKGYSPEFGVRNLQRTFEKCVLRPLSMKIDEFSRPVGSGAAAVKITVSLGDNHKLKLEAD